MCEGVMWESVMCEGVMWESVILLCMYVPPVGRQANMTKLYSKATL